MKMKNITNAIIVAVVIGIINPAAAVINCVDQTSGGLKCTTTPDTTSGGCSGSCPPGFVCAGGKTITQHSGCTSCGAGGEGDFCTALGCPQNCLKRTIAIPCLCEPGIGCLEGPAKPPTGWNTTPERLCN